jgi:hypothetical protein
MGPWSILAARWLPLPAVLGRFTDEYAQSAQRHWKVPKIE